MQIIVRMEYKEHTHLHFAEKVGLILSMDDTSREHAFALVLHNSLS